METVITRVQLPEDVVEEWDEAMTERMATAESAQGWVSSQLLRPTDSPSRRVIVGVWESREAWKAWHENPTFEQTRRRLEDLGVDDGEVVWHQPVYSGIHQ